MNEVPTLPLAAIPASTEAVLQGMERLLLSTVREELVPYESIEGGLLLHPESASEVLAPTRRRYSMARFDLAGWPLCTGVPIENLESLLTALHPHLDGEQKARLLAELSNSQTNTELSLLAERELGLGEPGRGSLSDWEGRVWLGHPLHPGARLRSGVSEKDNKRFGPEWQARFDLPLLQIPREDLATEGDFFAALSTLYPSHDIDGERVGVPVHPWAAEHDLPHRFQAQLDSGRWAFSDRTIPARPTMSFRSVILQDENGDGAHLKLPVAVQTTGATRTVSVAATHNGPLMSGFLRDLWTRPHIRERHLLDGLHLMDEPASFRLADNSTDNARFLAGILRRGPGPAVDGQRWLLPAAALLEPRANPLFVRAAEYYGVTPQELWREYVDRLLPPQAFLCGTLGVALEAHPQNVVVEFRGPEGQKPQIHFHYRDLGGIRLHPEILEKALRHLDLSDAQVPRFLPGSATSTQSVRDLSSKFIYSLLQNHLGELSRAIVRFTEEPETPYWSAVQQTLEAHRDLMGEDLAQRAFACKWDLKAMWRMRIDSAITEYTYSPVENPWSA